jgi:two-component system phosphate regulon sensor histidine kinase PhoR
MDWLVLLFVAAQAIALALVAAQAIGRGRQLDEVRELASGTAGGLATPGETPDLDQDPVAVVRRLRARARRLARQLEQERADAAYLSNLIGMGIVHLDDSLRVDLANAAAHIFLGRAPGTMTGRTAMEAFVDARIEAIVATARERGTGSGEVPSREPDGPTLLVRARRSPVRGIWVVLEDVAELRRLQRIRSEFIDNLSHELRTPLTTVGLLAEALSRDAETAGAALPARMRDRIAKVEIETGHLTQMVTELLDLAQIESGMGGQLHLDDVDLGEVATASVERLRLFAERQGVQLRMEAPGPVPAVRGDADRLGQVFVNLLHNAVKFSPGGGEVVVRVVVSEGEVIASVRDQGIGIPKAAQARIFERFYKVDRARSRGGGTGLGLSIARHVIAGHGGRLWVESEEGRGSTFSFAFPLAPPPPGGQGD